MKNYLISDKKMLEKYFEIDAVNLEKVKNGKIKNIEILIDDEEKTAQYIIVSNRELLSNLRDGIYIEDDYNAVKKFIEKELI